MANSNFGKALENNNLNIPPDTVFPNTNTLSPYVLVGDEAFTLETYLLQPYPGTAISGDIEKQIFNYRLSRARRVSKNAFGHLAHKWRLFFRSE